MAIDVKATRQHDDQSVHNELKGLQRHLFDLRTQAVTERLEDPSQLKKTRRDIARLKTILRERELAGRNG